MKKENSLDKSASEEEQLSILIHQAGTDARSRRKKALEEHFVKIKQAVQKTESLNRKLKPV